MKKFVFLALLTADAALAQNVVNPPPAGGSGSAITSLTGPITAAGPGAAATQTAATFNMGAADSASPAAETITVPNVVTGTLNGAGALWTFKDSNGTGTGGSGGYSWFAASPGSSGSTPLTQTSKMTLNNGGVLTVANNIVSSGGSITSANALIAGSTSIIRWSSRALLSSPAAAVLQQGDLDAAAPVAQTTQAQSVITGTSNTAGALWTFKDSNGTGTGGSGGYSWFTAAPSTTGSTPLTQTAKMTLSNSGNLQAVNLIATTSIAAGNSGSYSWTGRGVLSSPAVGGIQFGNTDSATPVAQTVTAQGVSAGTADTAGQLLKFQDSPGTGTGASGGFEWDTHPAGSTGSTQNATSVKMTLNSNGSLTVVSNLLVGSTSQFAWTGGRGILTSPAAGGIQFGGADAASPVAQTVTAQGVVTGTTDTAGSLWTFKDSNGTGTGGSGGYSWFTAAPGSSGSTPLTQTSKMTLSSAGNLIVGSSITTGNIAAGATGFIAWTGRGLLTSPAAGSVQFGNTDAAAPVAQTTQVQSVVTGTSNTAGALWKFSDSAGTGTGASGGYEWDTHPLGSTGSTPNAASNKMNLSSVGNLTVNGNITSAVNLFTSSGGQIGWSGRGNLTSPAANTVQLGNTDAASPVAQTITTQGVSAGTADTAGQLIKFQDSPGTGTGASGGFEWDTHPAGSTGSTQNTAVSKMTLSPAGTLGLSGGISASGNIAMIGSQSIIVTKGYTVAGLPASPGTGARAHVTDAVACTFMGALTGSGSTVCPVFYNGSAWVGG